MAFKRWATTCASQALESSSNSVVTTASSKKRLFFPAAGGETTLGVAMPPQFTIPSSAAIFKACTDGVYNLEPGVGYEDPATSVWVAVHEVRARRHDMAAQRNCRRVHTV